jgi:release factor glutamine methyltransferase
VSAITIKQALRQAQHTLYGSESAQIDSELLLACALGCSRTHLYTWPEQTLAPSQSAYFESLLDRRVLGEPIAYITGEREFWSLTLRVNSKVLIPRPETELLVETALQLLPQGAQCLADLGTGSGAIALALAKERPDCRVYGVDVSPYALRVASDNALLHKLENIRFSLGSWCDPLPAEPLALIVSNPPYIDPTDAHLSQGDLRFEPPSALSAGDSGIADIRTIIMQAPAHLREGGWLLLEHGFEQAAQVRALLIANGFQGVRTLQDLNGLDRVTIGHR